ncbi:MAG: InlB B-repeat-containing protein, partial [Oscillospiraceae bacterium]|nr:InlB B-repeat-containing protein [Oscillospiraceae bacterium]
ALLVMNGGYVRFNSSPFGGGISLHANVASTAQINAGTITGNESTGDNAVGAGILFYNGGANVACNVYLGVTPAGVPTAGPVILSNNQALQGTAGGIGATYSAGTLPTASQLLSIYWTHLYVGPNVYFSGNQSNEGRDISGNACTTENCTAGDVDVSMELLCTQFRSLSSTHIQATNFTAPFTYAYNDFDIQMPIGCTVAAVTVTFRPLGGESFTYIVPQGGVVPNPTPVEGCGRAFTFWYEDPERTIPWDFETEIYYVTDIYGLDQYIPCIMRNVIFFTFGGSAVPAQTVVMGTAAAEPPPPTRGCDRFGGWYIDPTLTTPYNFSSPIMDNTILYARWLRREE